MINGFEYGFEDIQCVINGLSLEGFTEVKYGAQRDHKNVHGRMNVPVSMSRGKKDSIPGKLVILQSQFEALVKAAPGFDPTDWSPFNMSVSYAPEGAVSVTDNVPFCRVSQYEKGMADEDGNMTIELQLVTGIPQLNV